MRSDTSPPSRRARRRFATGAIALAFAVGCQPPAPVVPDDIFSDLGDVAPYADASQLATFDRGREVALRRFTIEEGLGPTFNVSSCSGCHERPAAGGSAARYRDFLLVRQALPDGSQTAVGVNGIQDQFSVDLGREPDADGANLRAIRNPIPMFGVGLLAELPASSILANADPDDLNHDGISGRPNYDRGFVGRFGRKAQTVSIEGFIRGPIFNHMGITSNPLSEERKAQLPVPSGSLGGGQPLVSGSGIGVTVAAQAAAPDEPTLDDDGVPDPELSEGDLFDLVSFAMLLGAPRPDEPTPESEEGRVLFDALHCTGCHVPTLLGPRGLIPAYSDLLLHDMGPELADGVTMGLADGNEFRTQPLWGIAAEAPYLHDGSADTLDEAIRRHGGEGRTSRDAYVSSSDQERALVLAFLASLGGRSQASEGLVPPGTPIAAVGSYGGPARALSAADEVRFLRGRSVFDRDVSIAAGLGPSFNGDSCRACHFDPVIGGSGPIDVDVTRQGIADASGAHVPSGGSMAHRFTLSGERPPVDPLSDVFELRQTPAVFGLGLVDRIEESAIRANEDPTDADGDGISGRAHVLADGRVGRLGWRADVPSLIEFSRDATTNELGLSVPAEAGTTFGRTSDADAAPDPEMSLADLEDMRFFLAELASPPASSAGDPDVSAGEAVFTSAGCASCHRTMALPDGSAVRLFSDLLLHDVAPADYRGVPSGDATGREFRTAPLWGLPRTGPYMHDGRAATIEAAIEAHAGEASASVSAVSALSAGDRQSLLAFLGSL